jgi:hypothetical protein
MFMGMALTRERGFAAGLGIRRAGRRGNRIAYAHQMKCRCVQSIRLEAGGRGLKSRRGDDHHALLVGAALLLLETVLPGMIAGLVGMGCLIAAVVVLRT